MNRAEIYRRAAKLVETGKSDRSCWAVQAVLKKPNWEQSKARQDFIRSVLCGTEATSKLYYRESEDVARDARIVALCFAAAMAETGDL